MNMKKTIAALAAGAVAVSAMATTVSALQDTSLTYNLVKTEKPKKWVDAAATYEFTLQDVVPATNYAIEFTVDQFLDTNYDNVDDTHYYDKVNSVVIKVASSVAGDQNKIFTYSTDKNALNYNNNIVTDAAGKTTITLPTEISGYAADAKLTLTVTVNTTPDKAIDSVAKINQEIIDGTIFAAPTANASPVVVKAFTKAEEKEHVFYVPFKTEIKNNQNITKYLQNVQGYHNVGAVLNDAIENYESVTFTFNTATTGIAYTVENAATGEEYFDKVYGGVNGKYSDVIGLKQDKGYTREDAVKASTNEGWQEQGSMLAIYDAGWYADMSYTSFDQHLYQGTTGLYGSYADGTSYASENSGYLGFDWTGYNLFQGALIINENLTMSLAETDYFDWTATSLSFDWDAIMDGAMTSNDYAVYLHSMKLATSNTWYWDNMVVTLTAGAAEDGVDAEAGVEADDEELAEEEVEEEVVEEEVEEEVEVSNPTTGNASVALAVIPVALAAAAVVAKKRS